MSAPKSFPRRTVASDAAFAGLGLHSGVPVNVRVLPGDNGIAFRAGAQRWEATPENVTDTQRCTRLGEVSTIEHLMSALAALGVTDCEVEVDGGELPGLDGSSAPYIEGLQSVGLTEIGLLWVTPPFARVFEKGDRHMVAIAGGTGHWRYDFVTSPRWPNTQSFESLQIAADYVAKVAPARTTVFEEEIEVVRSMGLGQGLDEKSCLVIGREGYRNQERFVDEPARHKLLDLIGDLFLSGMPIEALDVHAERSGHTANVTAARKLALASKIERD